MAGRAWARVTFQKVRVRLEAQAAGHLFLAGIGAPEAGGHR